MSLGDNNLRRTSLFSISRPEISAKSQIDASDVPDVEQSKRPVTPLENTYKMDTGKTFSASAVEKVMQEVLEGQLEEEKYDPRASKQVSFVCLLLCFCFLFVFHCLFLLLFCFCVAFVVAAKDGKNIVNNYHKQS
eukprot:m.41268 g.41268  ORF g.41268 m.41268 type:complete len:135 (-) comp10410_c0_seq1:998-1402(-)